MGRDEDIAMDIYRAITLAAALARIDWPAAPAAPADGRPAPGDGPRADGGQAEASRGGEASAGSSRPRSFRPPSRGVAGASRAPVG
jgi:hypothetical protein